MGATRVTGWLIRFIRLMGLMGILGKSKWECHAISVVGAFKVKRLFRLIGVIHAVGIIGVTKVIYWGYYGF
jgi:hypothetical protein